MENSNNKGIYTGITLAVLATLIWAGNFIIARGVYKSIPPISLAFYRWLLASLLILPFGLNTIIKEWKFIKHAWQYLFWVALTGVALFNTFVYIGAHYTSAINLALIGTTSSPIFSVILARIFLKEKIGTLKIIGMAFCLAGVLYLLSRGVYERLLSFQFTKGDAWVLLAALAFAIYNTLVKKKPASISPLSFLTVVFIAGTLLLFPFYIYEFQNTEPVNWNLHLFWSIFYLGFGASVICFLIWNIAIRKLGAGRTALFGNLIPIFSSLGAVIFLKEEFTSVHIISMTIVFIGILIANLRLHS
jgi:drug/metabolite transporter (DMT)-like permease